MLVPQVKEVSGEREIITRGKGNDHKTLNAMPLLERIKNER